MVTVATRSARPASAGPASTRHHAQLLTTVKRNHKVIMEEITQQKKSLVTVEYHKLDPPHGYTFVPAGDPELTGKCKEFARLKGSTVYVVSTSGPRGNELSQQVHRVGYHFPTDIVTRACNILDIDLDQLDDFLRKHEEWPEEKPRRANLMRSKKSKKSVAEKNGIDLKGMSQAELDKQARSAILDMFPTIPKANMDEIVDHAFELGSDRVGVQVSDLSLPRRAQLAVVAHIRHTYTEYDELLREMSWAEARRRVAPKTLEKLALWRGDKDDEPDTMEDILREVVVISDDEDEDDDDESRESSRHTSRPGLSRTRIGAGEPPPNFDRAGQGKGTHPGGLPNVTRPTATMIIRDRPQAPLAYKRSEAQAHRRHERIQAWEQARSRLKQDSRPTTRLDLQQPYSRTVPNNDFQAERQIQHRMTVSDHNSASRQDKNDDFRRRDGLKETIPLPYGSNRTLQATPGSRSDALNIKPAINYRYAETANTKYDPPFRNLQEVSTTQPAMQRISDRHPTTAAIEPEVVIPSIESPVKPDDMAIAEGSNAAIMVDSPTYERQFRYDREFLIKPHEPPYHLSLKRRREASPVGLHESSQQVLLNPSKSAYHSQQRLYPPLPRSSGKQAQGNVTYLPIREELGPSTNSLRANMPSSQTSLAEDRQFHGRQLLPNFSRGPQIIQSKGNHLKDKQHQTEILLQDSPRHAVQTRHVLGEQKDAGSYFNYYDHSGRQIYINGRPMIESPSTQSDARNIVRPAQDQILVRAQEPILNGQRKPQLQRLPLEQYPFRPHDAIRAVGEGYEPLRIARKAGEEHPNTNSERLVKGVQDGIYATANIDRYDMHHRQEMRGSQQTNMPASADERRPEVRWPVQRRQTEFYHSTQPSSIQRVREAEDTVITSHNRHRSTGVVMLD